jgi:hypothetical protein
MVGIGPVRGGGAGIDAVETCGSFDPGEAGGAGIELVETGGGGGVDSVDTGGGGGGGAPLARVPGSGGGGGGAPWTWVPGAGGGGGFDPAFADAAGGAPTVYPAPNLLGRASESRPPFPVSVMRIASQQLSRRCGVGTFQGHAVRADHRRTHGVGSSSRSLRGRSNRTFGARC